MLVSFLRGTVLENIIKCLVTVFFTSYHNTKLKLNDKNITKVEILILLWSTKSNITVCCVAFLYKPRYTKGKQIDRPKYLCFHNKISSSDIDHAEVKGYIYA